jgi:hypothetical protein
MKLFSERKSIQLSKGIKAYFYGLCFSTTMILLLNDIFYENIIKGNSENKLDDLRPREIFGTGAKTTFIKHKLEEKSTHEIYAQYISERKQFLEEKNTNTDNGKTNSNEIKDFNNFKI